MERICCGRRACGLVGVVGLFSTSLWAGGYCGLILDELVGSLVYRAAVTRVLCAAELTLGFFSR